MNFKNNTPASINIGGSVYSAIATVSICDFALSTSDFRWGYRWYRISHTPLTVALCHLRHDIAPICRSRLIAYQWHRTIAPTLTSDYPILRSPISSEPSIRIRDPTVHDPSHIARRHSITPSASPSPIAICDYILTVDQARDPTVRIKSLSLWFNGRFRFRLKVYRRCDIAYSTPPFPDRRLDRDRRSWFTTHYTITIATDINFSSHMDLNIALSHNDLSTCLIEHLIWWHIQLHLRLSQRCSITLFYGSMIQSKPELGALMRIKLLWDVSRSPSSSKHAFNLVSHCISHNSTSISLTPSCQTAILQCLRFSQTIPGVNSLYNAHKHKSNLRIMSSLLWIHCTEIDSSIPYNAII